MLPWHDAIRSRLIAAPSIAVVAAALSLACGARDPAPTGTPSPAPGAVQAEPGAAVDARTATPVAAVDAPTAEATAPPTPAALAELAEQLDREGTQVQLLTTDQVPADWSGAVLRTIRPHNREVRACYTRRLADKPALAGKVTATFAVGRDGAVTSASATGMDERVATCIANIIRGLTFPPPADGTAKVTFPFVFTAAP
jgi:outer membrane biosynthesis protein TonB